MKNSIRHYTYICILPLLLQAAPLLASDQAKEQRWAEQIVDSLIDGESIWLSTGKQRFLGIYSEQTSTKARGGVVLMHGIGVHPNWPDVIYPLRTQLPLHGWTTLSIQMPILHNRAGARDYLAIWDEGPTRIDAAIAYLQKNGIKQIALVGHSLGAAMASHYLASGAQSKAIAFVGIGMNDMNFDTRMSNVYSLERITLPVLDIYGGNDLESVLNSVKARRTAANKSGNRRFVQVEISGADHFFRGMEDPLVKRVRGWLDRNAVVATQNK